MPEVSESRLIQAGLWQWSQGTGLERFELRRSADEWILQGTVLTLTDNQAAEARYEIACDSSWRTKRARISLRDVSGERVLDIRAENGRWYENGHLNEAVNDAVDIDLGWSPSTNTLPIRRLQLDVGQSSGVITAAWVRFPELTLQPLPQEYLRTSENEYRYSSRGGAFVARISVDEDGVVLDYEGYWRRVDATT